MIRTTNVRDGFIDLADCRFVEEETFRKWTRRASVLDGDVLLTREAPIGEVGLVRGNQTIFLGQRVMQYRANRALLDPRFLCYAFLSPQLQHQFGAHEGSGSVVSHIRVGDCSDFKIPLPPLAKQREIADLLGALDERRLLLHQTNITLESVAQALFKSWFIDFDPVRAKAEGREPEGMDAATAALFPTEFEESGRGLIPKGWKVVPFADTVEILGGGTPKTSVSEYWGGDIPWFSVVDAPAPGQVFALETEKQVTYLGLRNSSTRLLPPWTTIISARGTVGKLAMAGTAMAMNQSCYGLSPKMPGGEVAVYLSAQRLVDDLKRLAHGGVFDTITRQTLASVQVCQPSDKVLDAFVRIVRPLFERILAGVSQAATLQAARDTLLPRLISGKLRLHEIEAQLERAVA
jgi:type I restriction enzyme S subunit